MMGAVQSLQRERILPLNREADYLEARRIAAQTGSKMPSNVLHDEYLSTDRWKALGALYPAWSDELLVYPERGGRFRVGKDAVDSQTGWIFPASSIPREAFDRIRVGLIVSPLAITQERGRIVVHADKNGVRVLSPFIQESGKGGRMDPDSGVPLDIKPAVLSEKRYLVRKSLAGVSPIARFTFGEKVSVAHVYANGYYDDAFGVSIAKGF